MSATQRVLKIAELLNVILSSLPPAQLALTVRVNRDWFFSSIPILWKTMRFSHACTPLSPHRMAGNCFGEPPAPAHWERFLMYSTYVRAITGCGYDFGIISEAIHSRPSSMDYLFPNLRSLEWHTVFPEDLSELNLLIPPTLESFNLNLPNVRLPSFQLLCETLSSRLKSLKFLVIAFNPPTQDRRTYIECQRRVTQAKETIEELLKLPKLRDLLIGTSFDVLFEDTYSEGRKWSDYVDNNEQEGDGFGLLEHLLFSGSQHTFGKVFLNRFTLSSLVVFDWYRCMKLEDTNSLIAIISNVFHQLKTLTLGDSEMFMSEDLPLPIIPWSTIQNLLQCTLLTSLSLHCCHVLMDREDLVRLLTSRPDYMPTRWKVLEVYTADPLSISDLLLFLKYCPRLHRLGIHFDGRYFGDVLVNEAKTTFSDTPPQQDPQPALVEHQGYKGFTSLTAINFAYSPLDFDFIADFSFFLLGICEEKPVICGWDWEVVGDFISEVGFECEYKGDRLNENDSELSDGPNAKTVTQNDFRHA
ncbi:hypothetical protein Clacol_007893 [Clathrus columnatus]|uniref:F-box domain-containing protein n=1 Tax=Clathrus columnatus TaxID=1419009 RepID=A0AAV5AG62_9AGAM|nr:hypothetical protein Clacol_007893 [Clathrus columnatus]